MNNSTWQFVFLGGSGIPILPISSLARHAALIAWILFFMPHLSSAQQPLFLFPEGAASWTVTCEVKKSSDSPASNPAGGQGAGTLKSIEVAQTDKARRSVITSSDGKSRQLWSLPKMYAVITEDGNGGAFVSSNPDLYADPFSPSNFNWIKAEYLTNKTPVRYMNIDCNHYKGVMMVNSPIASINAAEPLPCEAWIDVNTLRPVALLKGDVLGTFTFGSPPASLEIPEKFAQRLEMYRIEMGIK